MSTFTYVKKAKDSFHEIRNIFCVGRNFRDHATELGNTVPTEPMIFAKSTHALSAAEGNVVLPADRAEIHHELEIVLFISQDVTEQSSAKDVVGRVALGLDLTDRAAQSRLKEKGHPWEFAKSFVGSAILTDVYEFNAFENVQDATFELQINGKSIQVGHPADMVFDFDTLVRHVHKHFGLNRGDILFTGTPAGVGPLNPRDECVMKMNGKPWGSFSVLQNAPETTGSMGGSL